MFERGDGLGLDVVALRRGAVEEAGRVDYLVADVVALEVADANALRREGVLRYLVAGARDRVDERRLADVRVAGDDYGRVVRVDVGQVPEVVARVADARQVVADLLDHVGEASERLLAELARGVRVAGEFRLVLPADLLRLPGGPLYLGEALAHFVHVHDGVGEFVVEGVDLAEVGPRRDDVLQVVRENVRGGLEHRLLGFDAALGSARARRPRERHVE